MLRGWSATTELSSFESPSLSRLFAKCLARLMDQLCTISLWVIKLKSFWRTSFPRTLYHPPRNWVNLESCNPIKDILWEQSFQIGPPLTHIMLPIISHFPCFFCTRDRLIPNYSRGLSVAHLWIQKRTCCPSPTEWKMAFCKMTVFSWTMFQRFEGLRRVLGQSSSNLPLQNFFPSTRAHSVFKSRIIRHPIFAIDTKLRSPIALSPSPPRDMVFITVAHATR